MPDHSATLPLNPTLHREFRKRLYEGLEKLTSMISATRDPSGSNAFPFERHEAREGSVYMTIDDDDDDVRSVSAFIRLLRTWFLENPDYTF